MATAERQLLQETGKIVELSGLPGGMRHYVTTDTGDRPPYQAFVSDEAYPEVLSATVPACVDIVVFDQETGRMLVATRQQEPHPGAWIFGGRKRAGQYDNEAAAKTMKREFGVVADPSAFIHIGAYDMLWDTRAQKPTTNERDELVTGCHMTASVLALPVNERDIDLSGLNGEYSHVSWVPIEDVMDTDRASGKYHIALIDTANDLAEYITRPQPPASLKERRYRAAMHVAALDMLQREEQTRLMPVHAALSELTAQRSQEP